MEAIVESKNKISENLQKIWASQKKINKYVQEQIKFSEPIIERDGYGVIYPNTINIIQGKSGVHKSRLAENLCCSILTKDGAAEFLGFRTNISRSYDVLYVDTERNIKDQLPFAIQRINENSGFNKHSIPANFSAISLLDIERSKRFEALKDYLFHFRNLNSNHMVVMLDVMTDCLMNFNDPAESMKLIDLLNLMINDHDVTFICLIHENPSSVDKARGHIGSEANNKSSTVIQIGFEKDSSNHNTELIKVSFLKCRSTKKLDPFYLSYSEEVKGLVCAEPLLIQNAMDSKNRKVTNSEIKDFLAKNLIGEMGKLDLVEMLSTEYSCTARTIETRLGELIKSKSTIKKDMGVVYCLTKKVINRNVYYRLLEAA